ncbi:unnamed protein product [Arabidopsis arenosa]|uniref:HTH OST-type domain-containing protein n=1 Tax=Arabidopsis arenosa TaxID=38785 RepID=A0A8S2B7L1_ARAAE|nr:unnamed protein product [Arabidopsis arenosa]
MQFGSSKSLFFRLAGFSSISVFKPRSVISVLVTNFSSSSSISGHFTSLRRHQYEEESRSVRVHVWWDFENCHLPSGANVFKLAQTITSAVRINGMKGPITITAFGDLIQLSRTNQEALFATGINLTHVPQGGKNSTDRSLITDLMWWVLQNPPPAHIFLITSDRDFANVLHRLRMNNYNILLAGYEEATHGVLCSAASIMWDWDALVRGKNPTGKYYNQPPDGPYNSWYGHYRTPLLDPFATSSTTTNKQISCTSVKTIELVESNSNATNSGSSKACLPVPKGVVKQIGLILSWYPKGAPITELREQLRKRKVHLDRDFYGYKSFSRFLLSMPKILQVVPLGDGMFSIHAVTQGMNNKASSPNVTSENHKVVSLDKMCEDMKQSDKNVKEESQLQENSQESVQVIKQIDVKPKEEPVKTTQLALTVVDDVSPSEEKDGFLKKLNRLWFGSPEIVELEHLEEKKHISGNGDEGKGVVGEEKVVNTDLESRIASSTSSESAEEVKADTEDIESFINSPRGFVLVSHSRSREAMAKNLKEEGPSSLKPLDVSKMLDLVSMLITEKKWIQENPADALPFRVTWFTAKSSCLSNPPATEGLRSIFVNMSKSLCDKANGEKKIKDVGMSQKPKERLRSQVIADCHKLIKKIRKENPGGYNMSNFKKDFLVKFGYRLEHHNLGYPKLQSLIQMIPEARIESGYIVPSSTPVPYESDSLFEDLGPVSKKIHENESSVSEEEDYNSETDEEASVKQNDEERKKKKEDETECDLLQILGSWDTDKKQKKSAKTFGEDKLVEGILLSLRKKPSGDSRIQD